ncbi:bifunctional adenosylcobinamide kinase/adenosylcobinamide-phosphate guanylyltransferase [Sphingomonas bacterium]|uniref:bifunctional adenosylcobinamide kinase/adenosylcobinamide-phosphate guanylyltransferase n=1 Tax=Sphingomonas bacterium TaxID=1895847 RepID=UPI001576A956|nr:bifunctional adenosylcobinamide kinase/adenosylcobinamide-phosphate guanylyltransferase [Sphingomonas bacterium]
MAALLVLGGARSGKSRYAQARAEAVDGARIFIATAQAFDDEMTERIARHRADRDQSWRTIEAPLDLAEAIATASRAEAVILVDCLTLWMSNVLLADRDTEAESLRLAAAVAASPAMLILVSNEVGFGIVPDNALARRFRDAAGTLNQSIARIADEVILVAAGLPLKLKPSS